MTPRQDRIERALELTHHLLRGGHWPVALVLTPAEVRRFRKAHPGYMEAKRTRALVEVVKPGQAVRLVPGGFDAVVLPSPIGTGGTEALVWWAEVMVPRLGRGGFIVTLAT